ncbi:MAG: choice-of-anchor E domain-containing protein [Phycisphaerae bacterium]|nr:choice-of-anchor E domain-containing protein [Phycisphaerae bacterium]
MARGSRSVVSLSARSLGASVALLAVAASAEASTTIHAAPFEQVYLAAPYPVNGTEEKVVAIPTSALTVPQFSAPHATLLSVTISATFADDITFTGTVLGPGVGTIGASATTKHCVTAPGVAADTCASSSASESGTTTRNDPTLVFHFPPAASAIEPLTIPSDAQQLYVGGGTVDVSAAIAMTTVASVSKSQMLANFEGTFSGTVLVTYEYLAGDFDGSATIDGSDLATLIGAWGTPNADLDGDGTTNAVDLAILLGDWS